MVSVQLVASLFDEIGFRIAGPGSEFVVAETDPGFRDWFEVVRLAERLPDDWYERAERGEVLVPRPAPVDGP